MKFIVAAIATIAATVSAMPAGMCGDLCNTATQRCVAKDVCVDIPYANEGEMCNQFSVNPAECKAGLTCVKNEDPTKWFTCEKKLRVHVIRMLVGGMDLIESRGLAYGVKSEKGRC
ncbi:hypothetical protein HDU80_007235 [Chytriomyces hyalinus]|nr:hypothetical protein HDU80_007235 [Chytriomyces hyalinus]